MSYISPPDYNFVLTNALFENDEVDSRLYNKVEIMANNRKSLFIPVLLHCSLEELQRRVVSEDRKLRLKEICAENAAHYHKNEELLNPKHNNLFELDISNMQPQDAAQKILRFAQSLIT